MNIRHSFPTVLILTGLLFSAAALIRPAHIYAQGMMGSYYDNDTSASRSSTADPDGQEGQKLYEELQNKQIQCQNLTDDDFDKLGDYFMGRMMGSAHDAMDQVMTDRLGADGERAMHIAMGKRGSGCDTAADYPANGSKFLPMLGALGGTNGSTGPAGMMNGWFGPGNNASSGNGNILNQIITALVIVFLILGIVYFWKSIQNGHTRRS
ncbi:hypothetical protein M1555_01085 [Patescibacteria group bacterium]|nr:hypothetical protein [Patescibacteria group bacterium]